MIDSPIVHQPLRIGIDVGGTNTDAVLLDGQTVLASAKVATTPNVFVGISQALSVIESARADRPVEALIIGTTHFMNAIVQADELARVACIRLATPPQTLPPFVQWPERLATAIKGPVHVVEGGHQFTGVPMAPLDELGVEAAARDIKAAGIDHVVISAVFSPVEGSAETRAAQLVTDVLGEGAHVLRSQDIGQIGILERENAAILNASLLPLASRIVDSFHELANTVGANTAVYLSQNDGTLMSLDAARRYPILTVSSGPTNSMRGAALLSGERDAVVVDVGGTTSDVGLLQGGFPRNSVVSIDICAVRTNFRMPDVSSFGIGGGSLVSPDGEVGPNSVGYRLTDDAMVFGGNTLTLTDVAVAAGLVDLGDRARVTGVSREVVERALTSVRERLAAAVVAARLSADELPTVVVGGGAFAVDRLPGLADALRPHHSDVANALGAALAQVGGTVDSVYNLAGTTREAVLDNGRQLAIERAIAAGAKPDTVEIIDEEDVPLTHLPGGTATRVRVKAVGDLEIGGS
jgi:N-methylhydantoinase A/oxoprolinase/acetone carboxylase beta subunit